jgi:quercetin dioxygenase-like cupin family protein
MQVVNVHGYTAELVVGPAHGTSRLFIWLVHEVAGTVVEPHFHHGDELLRVLYGRLRFQVENQTREVGPGDIVIVPPDTLHGHTTLEDAEIEIFGEAGGGIFLPVVQPDGSRVIEELFVREVPWSRVPADDGQYLTPTTQDRLYHSVGE